MFIDKSFLRLESDWTAKEALELLENLSVRHAVVQRPTPQGELFYAYDPEEVRKRLRLRLHDKVGLALDLHEYKATPTFTHRPTDVNGPSVLLDGKSIVGLALPGQRAMPRNFDATSPDAQPRALVASAPPEVALEQEVSLLVKITTDMTSPGSLPMMLKVGDEIEVVLQPSSGLSIKGALEGKLTITEEAETLPLRFKIVGKTLGDGKVTVYAFQDGQAIGSVKVAIRVVNAAIDTSPIVSKEDMRAPVAIPDLSLLVLENRADRSYSMRLSAADPKYGLNFKSFDPIPLRSDAESFFASFFKEIEDILISSDPSQEKLEKLGSRGCYLFKEIVPEALRKLLWSLRTRIRSIQIQSEEPWIPWEVCKLEGLGDDGTTIVEGGFLCEEFELTRWLLEIPQCTDLMMRSIGLVVPAGSGLAAASVEEQFMLGLAEGERTVTQIQATGTELRKQLGSGEYDALHFTGHGSFLEGNADGSAIMLEHGMRFTPQDLSGRVANLGRNRHPLVFLNACEIGRSGMSLVGMGGWANAFLKAGAGAFIGPYWKVADGSAAIFAQTFYEELLNNNATIGKAAQMARAAIKQAGDPTWLAYTVYAHPAAKAAPLG